MPESPFSALRIPHPQLDSVMSANGDFQGLPAEPLDAPQRQVTFWMSCMSCFLTQAAFASLCTSLCSCRVSVLCWTLLEAPSARFDLQGRTCMVVRQGAYTCRCWRNRPPELLTLSMWRYALQVKAAVQEAPHPSAAKPQGNGRFTVVAQPIIVPRMIRPG